MTGFTPGPWACREGMQERWEVFQDDGRRRAMIAGGMKKDDAHLVAAAPTMLAALQAVLADCQSIDNDNGLSLEVGKRVRAALALATGK